VALVGGGLGVVGLGLGAYYGLRARSDLDASNADGHCHGNHCDPFGVQARSDAQTHANYATIAMAAGGVALATGAVLWLTAPRARASIAIVPSFGPHETGLSLAGRL
jgi:serine/threonine-protein kinase